MITCFPGTIGVIAVQGKFGCTALGTTCSAHSNIYVFRDTVQRLRGDESCPLNLPVLWKSPSGPVLTALRGPDGCDSLFQFGVQNASGKVYIAH